MSICSRHTTLLTLNSSHLGCRELAWHELIRLQRGLVMDVRVDLNDLESRNRPLINSVWLVM